MTDKKIGSFFIYFILILIFLAIQAMQFFSIGIANPDFIMIISIIYSFSRGSFKGEIFGFFVGFILDLMSGSLFGLNACIFTLLGLFAEPFQKIMKIPNIIVFIFYIIIATLMKYILYHVFSNIYQSMELSDLYFLLKIPEEILANIIFGILLYILISRIDLRSDYEWF